MLGYDGKIRIRYNISLVARSAIITVLKIYYTCWCLLFN